MKLTVEKIKLSELKKRFGNMDISVIIPKYNKSIKVYKTIPLNKTLQANIKEVRDIDLHCKYFAVVEEFIEQSGIDAILEKEENRDCEKILQFHTSDYLYKWFKWKFLPHIFETLPSGVIEIWSSISFEKMPDNIDFKKFYNDCLDYMANMLECDRQDLELYGSDNL